MLTGKSRNQQNCFILHTSHIITNLLRIPRDPLASSIRSRIFCKMSHWPWVELAAVLQRAGVVHGQLVALLRPYVAYFRHVQLVHLQAVLGCVGPAESHNRHHEKKSVTAHHEHDTRAVRCVRGHVHQSTDAREQLTPRSVLRRRAAFGSPFHPAVPERWRRSRDRDETSGTKRGRRARAVTLRRLNGLAEYVGLYLGKVLFSLSAPLKFRSRLLALSEREFPLDRLSPFVSSLVDLASLPLSATCVCVPHLRPFHGCIPE